MKEPVKHLQLRLREMIETDREKIVAMYAKWFKSDLEHFMEKRKPNLTVYEAFPNPNTRPEGIYKATNYEDAYKALGNVGHLTKASRPAFDVVFKPDADEIIHKMAEDEAENMIATFLARATEKLAPIVERHSKFTMEKSGTNNGFRSGVWIGQIDFKFMGGMEFVANLQVKINRSKFGKYFGQYPMTFHEVALPVECNDLMHKQLASIEDIWAAIGYVPTPPAKRPRWAKLKAGSVVMHEGQRHFISTPSVARKLGIPEDALQIARIEANETHCNIEYDDGKTSHFKYPQEQVATWQQIERDTGNYNKVSAMRREYTYKHFYPED